MCPTRSFEARSHQGNAHMQRRRTGNYVWLRAMTSLATSRGYIRPAGHRLTSFSGNRAIRSPQSRMGSPNQLILHWSLANPIILLTPPSSNDNPVEDDQVQHKEEKDNSIQSSSFKLTVEHIRYFQCRK